MQVSIEELRKDAAQVVSAQGRGETVVLTVHGRSSGYLTDTASSSPPSRATRGAAARRRTHLGRDPHLVVWAQDDDFEALAELETALRVHGA